ncbi:hypothetical protein KIL84_022680 [Mauremys mutica]|uniref:Uncharacterized protein n=1 Tax=Mauremys mutica TaxID=74926 RepID=A0A9D4AQU6_9SAUR|nr:hypothetical protein KIL84_022680 [Mauremys mutica]
MILRRMNETSSWSLLIRFRILQHILSGMHSLTVIGKITLINKSGGTNPACYPHSHMPPSPQWPYWYLCATYQFTSPMAPYHREPRVEQSYLLQPATSPSPFT